jgi:hypothetical protein
MPFLGTTGGGSVKQYGGLANLGYFIKNSLRFRSNASTYFNRTPASAGNRQIWTWSGWIKRGDTSNLSGSGDAGELSIFGSGTSAVSGNGVCTLGFTGYDYLQVWQYISGTQWNLVTTQVFRDYSAWYHIVFAVDTTQATASNRIKLYVNGVQVTAFGTASYPSQNYNTGINSTDAHNIGRRPDGSNYWGGYLTENNFIDGQQLTPSSFGKTDGATGQWIPKKFAGTYGTNGFYLKFADASAATAAAIGKDSSPNGNNWTPNNISVTAGATYDAMIDSPSLSAAASNYCTWNPLFRFSYTGSFAGTFSDGNLKVTTGGNPTQFAGTMELCDGAYYEVTAVSIDVSRSYIGLFSPSLSNLVTSTTDVAYSGTYNVLYSRDGGIWINTTTGGNQPLTGSTWTNGDVISVAYKSGKIYLAKNGVWQNSGVPASGTGFVASGWDAYGALLPYCGYNSTFSANFGQQPFAYTPPSGFKSLNAFNLP